MQSDVAVMAFFACLLGTAATHQSSLDAHPAPIYSDATQVHLCLGDCNVFPAPMMLRMRGGGDNAVPKGRRRKRKRTRKKKDIFMVDEARPKMSVPVSAQLRRLRGEIKDMKRPEDDSPRFVKDSPDERGQGTERGDREAVFDNPGVDESKQQRQADLRHMAWKAKVKHRKEQAFILKTKLERQRRDARRLQQQYLEPSGHSGPDLQVPMIAGLPLQERFSTPLPRHLLPESAKVPVNVGDSAQDGSEYGLTQKRAPELVGATTASGPDAEQVPSPLLACSPPASTESGARCGMLVR